MSKKLLLIGGGGHCKSVLDSLQATKEYSQIGIIEKSRVKGDAIWEVPIVGVDEDLAELFHQGYKYAFFSVGSTANPTMRTRFFEDLKHIGFQIPNVVDPSAVISRHAHLGEGVFVGKNAVINASARIGNGSIINTSAVIEYDCKVGDFAHISSGTVLNGGAQVGDYSHIGAGTIVKKKVVIGSYAMIGPGSIVQNNIADGRVASGRL